MEDENQLEESSGEEPIRENSSPPPTRENSSPSIGENSSQPTLAVSPQQLQDLIKSMMTMATAMGNQHSKSSTPPGPNVKYPDRPNIDLDSTEGKWAFFCNEWKLYKRRAKLPTSSPEELRACCSDELRQELFNFVGPSRIDTLNEDSLLSYMRKLAVRGKNKAVHRQEFYMLTQDPGTPAQQFVAQLRSKAEHCDFQMLCSSCNQSVSYATAMITDQMTVGLNDKDVQGEILAKDSQLHNFDDKFNLILAYEDGKRAKDQLGSESSVAAQSAYHKRRIVEQRSSKSTEAPASCSGCGSKEHGPGTGFSRKAHCPARNSTCDHCGLQGHYKQVCRKRKSVKPSDPGSATVSNSISSDNHSSSTSCFFANGDLDEFTYDSIQKNKEAWRSTGKSLLNSSKIHEKIIVPHLEWVPPLSRFAHRNPPQLPRMDVRIEVLKETHAAFHHPVITKAPQEVSVNAIADTGAQTCACGLDVLNKIGVSENDLIPTNHRINGVTSSSMDIAGVLFAAISANGLTSKQVIYVGRNIQGLFLSIKTLQELGSVSPSFPNVDKSYVNVQSSQCDCLKRDSVPPRPAAIPYTPSVENIPKLEK